MVCCRQPVASHQGVKNVKGTSCQQLGVSHPAGPATRKTRRMTQKHLPILNMPEHRYHGHLRQMGLAKLRFTYGEAYSLGRIFQLFHL
ncbi:mCG1036076 [Mus musculus]|nr:mCG1036076 [Mus musculus]